MAVTRFGLQIPNFTFPGVADRDLFGRIAAIAVAAEESGFDSLWVMDHYYQIPGVGPRTDPMFEAYTLLGGVAARTRSASASARWSPASPTATRRCSPRASTTLDVISGGRAILGIGAAWNDDEHAGYGFAFPPVPERMARLEEALQICRAMFTEAGAELRRPLLPIDHALNFPRPVRPVGASRSSSAARGELRMLAARRELRRRLQHLRRPRRRSDASSTCSPGTARRRARSGRDHEDSPRWAGDRRDRCRGRPEGPRDGRARGMDEERFRAYVVAGGPTPCANRSAATSTPGWTGWSSTWTSPATSTPCAWPARPSASLRREGRDNPRARQLTGDALAARAVAGPCRGAR